MRIGEIGVMVASMMLRQGALNAGATDDSLRAYLDSPAMRDVAAEVQQSEELMTSVNEVCGPFVSSLMEQ